MSEAAHAPIVAVVGGGDMAGAVARAMLTAPGLAEADGIVMRVTTGSSRPEWAEADPAVELLTVAEDPEANRRAVAGARLVMLGVQPGDMERVAAEIAPAVAEGAVVVSVSVRPSLEVLERILPEHVGVVRILPNLPIDIGEGVIGVAGGARASEEQLELLNALLATSSLVVPVDEEGLDMFSTIVGAAPAYTSYLIEALTAAAEAQGTPPGEAERIVRAAMRGAILRLDATGTTALELRQSMMHPGNVTDTAMRTLDARGVRESIEAAVAAGLARTREFRGL